MAKSSFTSIPFTIEAHQGLSKANGLAKFSSAGIVLEFEMKILGLVSTGVKEARLALEDISDIKFKKGFFKYGAKIEIRTSTFLKLTEVPNQDGKIILKIPRDDHARAAEAVDNLLKKLNEQRDALPPPQTPVSSLFENDTDPLETAELEENKPRS